MIRIAVWLMNSRAARIAAVLVFWTVNAAHALIHGTPLDGGALDGGMAAFDQFALAYISTPEA